MTAPRPLALITGASSGIGYQLAQQFTTHGYDVVVAAEDDGIVAAAATLARDGASAEAVQVDLRTAEGVAQLYHMVTDSDQPLAAAALNAGVGRGGKFVDTEIEDDFDIVDLNVRGTVQLAKLVLRDMAHRNSGKVLFTSSIASTMPGSYQPVYNASKSFIQSLAEAVRDELGDTDVTVTSLMPGPTDTNFFHRAKMADTPIGRMRYKDDPAEVARQGFEALMRGDEKVVAESLSTKMIGLANKVLPDSAKAVANRLLSAPVPR
ncbi:SDR family NAD(P)-dependent oxidoreductase [Mycolicibacterium rhodesiae]|uniref:Oxidoreductase n=1 Tax=Mycolicibacterium rhodesiae TaxID=36814 RepID=A0A1X0J200_MYCRH|nr:SDR family NAD(P)-dependent oxidoreductase [Mycolicibacterium rhodesiae]MCV7344594.1 SDR family NAD(P)-dependent oxidoreductase [Mycolicibacterium rhodesiae]ORB55920.1 oxidoreductase [Mycolicibacterium rhodesiae]